jgi:hypothetical protein
MINKIGIKIARDKPEDLKRTKQVMEHCALVGLARHFMHKMRTYPVL